MKAFLLIVLTFIGISCPLAASDYEWVAVVDGGGRKISLSRVDCLVAADGADRFSVMLNDGSSVDGVTSLAFERALVTSLELDEEPVADIVLTAEGFITVTPVGPIEKIEIFAADGRLVKSVAVESRRPVSVDVTTLATGCYALKAGYSSLKFVKK